MTREWCCSCGTWLSFAYGRHPHVKGRDRTVQEMVAARMGNEPDPLYDVQEISYEWRTPQHPVREVQGG
jgi:hypothetical protein